MKKVILISLFLVFGTSLAWAKPVTIQVVKPSAQENYIQGQMMSIEWSTQGQPVASPGKPQLVDIQLVNVGKTGVTPVKTIVHGTQNDGTHSWKIPLNVEPGTTYAVKVSIGSDVSDLSGLFKISPKVTWQAPGYAMIGSVKVNQQSPSNSCTDTTQRVSINLQQGIQIWVTATSVIQPILYKYKVELTDPYTGYDYAIHDGGWIQQSILNLNPTYEEVTEAVFPNGVGGSEIPVSLQGRVYVWVKNDAQTEPPQFKEICIRLWL